MFSPRLDDGQLEKLENVLKINIAQSHGFNWKETIGLGLESTLRAIKNNKVKCVLLSQQLKPRYVLGLIARNIQVVDPTVPVFEHPELEQTCQNLFGIRSLAMIIRKQGAMELNIEQWIKDNSFAVVIEPSNPVNTTIEENSVVNKKRKLILDNNVDESLNNKRLKNQVNSNDENNSVKHLACKTEKQPRPDFLSFDSGKLDESSNNVDQAAENHFKKLNTNGKKNLYKPLVVHKIQPNLNRAKKIVKSKKKK